MELQVHLIHLMNSAIFTFSTHSHPSIINNRKQEPPPPPPPPPGLMMAIISLCQIESTEGLRGGNQLRGYFKNYNLCFSDKFPLFHKIILVQSSCV